jgi:DNA-binding IscR family transcriptional regulator
MQLTITSEYAIRAMLELSSHPFGKVLQISEVSKRWDISETFLRKLIAQLVKAGFIFSRQGKIFLNKCLIGPMMCDKSVWCGVNIVWIEAQHALKEILAKRSLAEVVALTNERKAVFHEMKANSIEQIHKDA